MTEPLQLPLFVKHLFGCQQNEKARDLTVCIGGFTKV